MSKQSFIELSKCRWREFRREPSAFFWVVFMPILWMVVLGFAFSNPKPEHYGVAIKTDSTFHQNLLDSLQNSDQVKLKFGDEGKIKTWFKRGEVILGISGQHQNNSVTYYYDPANPESMRAKVHIDDLLQTAAGRTNPISTVTESLQSEGGRYVDFLIPGLLAFSILSSSLFGIGMTIVSNRKENLLKRYLTTPMSKYEFLCSHVVGRIIVLGFEFTAIMIAGYLLFGFQVYGNFLAYMTMAILGAAAFTSISLLCASRTRSIPMMAGVINLITIPMMLLSGVFFSKSNFPDWALSYINLLPLTALTDALRKIALEGLSFGSIQYEIMLLGSYFIVATIAAKRVFKWY